MKIDSKNVNRAMRVLKLVRKALVGVKFVNIDIMHVETYCNGREQGLCLLAYPSVRRMKDALPLRIMFAEHRIADSIVVYDEKGEGRDGNIPVRRSGEYKFHEREFGGNGQAGNEAAAAKAIVGIIESYDTELSEPWKHR